MTWRPAAAAVAVLALAATGLAGYRYVAAADSSPTCRGEELPMPTPSPPGGVGLVATDPTGRYQVGFVSFPARRQRTVLYTDGRPRVLSPNTIDPVAVNRSGVVVGQPTDNSGPWVYRDGTLRPLPEPVDLRDLTAVGVDDQGDVAGYGRSSSIGGDQAVVWPANPAQPARIMPGGDPMRTTAVSPGGGLATQSIGNRPWYWESGSGGSLSMPPDASSAVVHAVTGNWAVGAAEFAGGIARPVRWDLATGRATVLGVSGIGIAVSTDGTVLVSDGAVLVAPDGTVRLVAGLSALPSPGSRPPQSTAPPARVTGMTADGRMVIGFRVDERSQSLRPMRWHC